MTAPKHPETADLAKRAFEASGAKTHGEFCNLFGDKVIGLRTFRGWLKGENPAAPLAQMVLREFIGGWRPSA